MQKRTKNIYLILIWLIGLMFFAHSVIPHHHHFDSVFEHQQSTGQAGHAEDNPLHCHAFNDLAVDKAVVSFSTVSVTDSFTAVVPGIDLNLRLNDYSGLEIITLQQQEEIPFEADFLKSTPSRGSPVMA